MKNSDGHHFISQCYLKGFTKNRTKDSTLFAVNLSLPYKTFNSPPKNVAKLRAFNSIDGPRPDALEGQLSKFETEANNALLKIGLDKSLNDTEAWLHILNLAALFAIRNPQQREHWRKLTERTTKMIMDIALSTPERWISQMQQAQVTGFVSSSADISYEEMYEFYQNGEYTIEVPNAEHIGREFKMFDTVLNTLNKRKWTLCIAPSNNNHFITSDNPLILIHSDGATPSSARPLGHGLANTTVFFPINCELLAIGTFEESLGIKHMNVTGVANLNRIILDHAHKQIFCPHEKSPIQWDEGIIFAADIPQKLRQLNDLKSASTS